jgi:hypothetical protein
VISLAHIRTDNSIADCFTKRLPVLKRNDLFGESLIQDQPLFEGTV